MKKIFMVGCGYVGQRLARQYLAQGDTVTALSHTPAHQIGLQEMGIQVIHGDLDSSDSLPILPTHNSLLFYLAPPPAQGEEDTRIAAFLRQFSGDNLPSRFILISTTSVYGDCRGAWIDETQPLNPQAERAKRRVDAEQKLREWAIASAVPFVILRVPGIYGAARLPISRLEQGLPVLQENIAPYSNRIHVDDLVTACMSAGTKIDVAGAVYHLSDGNPSSMTDYFNQVADCLGLPRPPCIDAQQAANSLSAEMRSYLAESKRLDTRKMREKLAVLPKYPHLASGLAQCKVELNQAIEPKNIQRVT